MSCHSHDRLVIEDLPLGYGQADCIDCGGPGERRLPARFPHICHSCLFPPAKPDDHDAASPVKSVSPVDDLLTRTDLAVGVMYPGERRMA